MSLSLIIKQNKRVLQSYHINRDLFGEFPSQDDSIIIKNEIDDVCSICLDEIEINSKVKSFDCCNKKIHCACFAGLLANTNGNKLKCPNCRNESTGTFINNSLGNYCSFVSFIKKNKNTFKSPIYIDSDNNIVVRYSVFINKHKFFDRNDIRFTLGGYSMVNVLDIFNVICAFQNSDTKLFESLVFKIITQKSMLKCTQQNASDWVRRIKNNIETVSAILEYKNNEILSCVDNCIANHTNILINSNKINFADNLSFFLNNYDYNYNTIAWFKLNTIEDKRNFYNKYLVKICGEKFRKIIISDNIDYSKLLMKEYQNKHKKK